MKMVKSILTVDTALTVACTLLLGYFTWSSKSWVEKMELKSSDTEFRIAAIEVERKIREPIIEKRLDKMDEKLDWLVKDRKENKR